MSVAASGGGLRTPKRRVFLRGSGAQDIVSEQSGRLPRYVMRTTVGVVLGLALGFAIGWWLWPVQYTNTGPDVLRQDYRDDYVVMVATAYEAEGSLELARERLRLLDPVEPSAPVVELAERLGEAGNGGAEDLERLTRLAWALGAPTPPLAPDVEGRP